MIDCDLRKSSLYKNFKVSNVVGLFKLMVGKAGIEEAIQKRECNLDVLTSGKIPPNPSEILASSVITDLIEKHDGIILDSGLVVSVTDAQILSTKVDGTILVTRQGLKELRGI